MRKYLETAGRTLVALMLLILIALSACDEDPTGSENGELQLRLRVHSGNNQTDRAGATLPDPLVVQVYNILDTPQPGIEVLFTAADPGGSVSPPAVITDSDGLASCLFTLGSGIGDQRVKAVVEDEDSLMLTATAVEIECDEERPSRLCDWRSDRIYITTTSSSLIGGTGSVLIEYDPVLGEAVELFETSDNLLDLSFSSRGELFVTTAQQVMKVDPSTYLTTVHVGFSVHVELELEPNSGGILAGVSLAGPFSVGCYPPGYFYLNLNVTLQHIRDDCLAAHPVSRDLFVMTGAGPPNYMVWRIDWDGRDDDAIVVHHADILAGAATPRGMCIDSTGTLYISFDGNDTFRRVVKVTADGSVDAEFVNFYAAAGGNSQEAGRWGDIAYTGGKLYLIDTRNNRLAEIDVETGALELGGTDFRLSKAGAETERYGIAVRPPYMCAGSR
jgi:hypothetical protein